MGFWRKVYFVSVGYTLTVITVILAVMIFFWKNISWLTLLQCATLIFWGMRLGIFIVKREMNPNFNKERERIDREYGGNNLLEKFIIWIIVSLVYVMMVSPSLFSLGSPYRPTVSTSILQGFGLLGMIAGLILEGTADRQKSAFKAKNPNSFCNTGLYRWVRCPNYLGEIIFWVCNWIMGLAFYKTPIEWIVSLIGLASILFVMISSTRRLESTQIGRYGSLPEFQQYTQVVPILFPYIPLYTLQNIKILFG